MPTSLQKGALSNDLKGVVAKIFPGASSRTPIFARFARVWYLDPECEVRSDWSDHWVSSQEDCPFLVVHLNPIPITIKRMIYPIFPAIYIRMKMITITHNVTHLTTRFTTTRTSLFISPPFPSLLSLALT